MKGKLFIGLLCLGAAFCVALRVLQASFTGVFSSVMAFPFEQIGMGLRSLSLSGTAGNILAFVVYLAISLLPGAALLILRRRRGLHGEDALLGLLSIILFAVLYMMVNPGVIGGLTGGSGGVSVGKAILGGMVYSVLCGYLVLRVLQLFSAGGTDKLLGYMSVMLGVLGALFVYAAFYSCVGGYLEALASLKAGNVGNEQALGASNTFLFLQLIVDALPYVLNIFIILAALRLLREMRTDRYSDAAVIAAENMSKLCVAALTATVLSNIGFNLLQLLSAEALMVLNTSVQIPVLSIAFVLAALLLTRFVTENKILKDDNDMFI